MHAANSTNGTRYSEEDDEEDGQVVDIWDTASPITTSICNSASNHNSASNPQEQPTSTASFRATLADTLQPIYISYLQEMGQAKIPLVETLLSTGPAPLEFAEICKLVSEHGCAGAERPLVLPPCLSRLFPS